MAGAEQTLFWQKRGVKSDGFVLRHILNQISTRLYTLLIPARSNELVETTKCKSINTHNDLHVSVHPFVAKTVESREINCCARVDLHDIACLS